MTSDERDKLMLFLIERHEEVMADLGMLKDAQLRTNAQIEKLTKVVYGLAQQINEVMSRLEQEGKLPEEGWLEEWPSLPISGFLLSPPILQPAQKPHRSRPKAHRVYRRRPR